MVASKFTDKVQGENKPVDFHACAREAFDCSHKGLSNQQTAANIAALTGVDEGRRQGI